MIRVLLVDDSAVVRRLLTAVISQDPRLQVVGALADPLQVIDRLRRGDVDLLVLDLEMPRRDGLSLLREIMRLVPLPVVVCSGQTGPGSVAAARALAAGAVDAVPKPQLDTRGWQDLLEVFVAAARARVARAPTAPAPLPALALPLDRLVLIGASTGGPQAIEQLLQPLPARFPPILIVQHMLAGFTAGFAERLRQVTGRDVREAVADEVLQPGQVRIAPGGRHLQVQLHGGIWRSAISDAPPVLRHRPAVDVLFASACPGARQVVAALLTGMGDDGARGLLALRQAGARTLAQDADSCAVYGMPRAAADLGAAEQVIPLDQMAAALVTTLGGSSCHR